MVTNSIQQYILTAYNMLNMLFNIVTNTEEKFTMVLALKYLADLLKYKKYTLLLSQNSALLRSAA